MMRTCTSESSSRSPRDHRSSLNLKSLRSRLLMVGRYRKLVRGKQVRINYLKETRGRALTSLRLIISTEMIGEHTVAQNTDLEIVSAMDSKVAVQTHRQISGQLELSIAANFGPKPFLLDHSRVPAIELSESNTSTEFFKLGVFGSVSWMLARPRTAILPHSSESRRLFDWNQNSSRISTAQKPIFIKQITIKDQPIPTLCNARDDDVDHQDLNLPLGQVGSRRNLCSAHWKSMLRL